MPARHTTATAADPMPQAPAPLDLDACCGAGCDPCVLELQAEALERYRAELAAWKQRQAPHGGPEPAGPAPARR